MTFDTVLQELTMEIFNDLDDQVALEGINIFTEYYFLFHELQFNDEYKPRLCDLLQNAIENRLSSNLQARLSHLQGPILHRLHTLNLLSDDLIDLLFQFFCICLKEPVTATKEQSFPDQHNLMGSTLKEHYYIKHQNSLSIL